MAFVMAFKHFLALMASKIKIVLESDPLLPNDLRNVKKLSKFNNFKVWPLLWPSKFFWHFYIFPGHFKVQIVEINQN